MQEVFGHDILVKLDSFHAMNRVVKTIPKRCSAGSKLTGAQKVFLHDFKNCFRCEEDSKCGNRGLPTPSEEVIVQKFTALKDRFSNHLSNVTVMEIDKLIGHAKQKTRMFKVCFTKESQKSVISIISIFSGIAARRGTHWNENLHGHVRRFLSGRSSCGPKVFNALIHTYIIRRNESLQGVSEPPPIFTPSCGDPLPSLHDTDEKKSDERELSQSQRGNVDTDLISLIVENTKMLLRTCDYLKRKSFLETCDCLLNPVSKFSFDKKLGHSEKLSSDDTIETFCSVLRKYNASTLCDFVPERSVFLATSLYLAKNHPQIALRSPLGEVCGALIDNPRVLADHLMDLSLRELRDNVDKYITSTSSNVSDFVSLIVLNAKTSWTRSPLRKELTEALMNVLKCPLVFLSSDDEKEIQLLVPEQ